MGNIKSTIDSYMKELDELISKGNLEEAKTKFVKYENELKHTGSEDKKAEIINILIDFLEPETKKNLKNYIWNLRSSDRIYLLFKEIYEEKLLASCNFEFTALSKEKEINEYIEKTQKVFNLIGLVSKVSVINERLSNLYFKLVDIKYQKIMNNPKLDEIEEIISLQEKCLQYIKNTINTEQTEEYQKFLVELLNIKYKLLGIESQKTKKYEDAIEYYKKITIQDETIFECMEKCYEEIMFENERNKNFEKALEALENMHTNMYRIKQKEVELKMKLIYQKIQNQINDKNYYLSLDLYYDLLEFKIDEKLDHKYFEQDFEKYNELFISTLITITFYSYKENNISKYISILEEKVKIFKKEKVLFYIKDLLVNLKKIENDKKFISLENIIKNILDQEKLSEIEQRIFLTFLIELYLNDENKQKILETLNDSKTDFIYLTEEEKNVLYEILNKEDLKNIDMIFLISKVIYKITIKEVAPSSSLFKIVKAKIKNFYKQKELCSTATYYDSIKLLMKIFENIILKSDFNLSDPIIIYTNLLGLEKIRKDVIKGLVTFVQSRDNEKLNNNTIIFFMDYILSKNEEINNLLETILHQLKLQKNFEKKIIFMLFQLLIFYKKEKNETSSQEKIIKLLIDENIDEKVLTDLQIIKKINEYLKIGNSCRLIFDFIFTYNKIPEERISFDMREAYNNYLDKLKVNQGDKNKVIIDYREEGKLDPYQLINILKMSNNINENIQIEIEDNLHDPKLTSEYITCLKISKNLFQTMNLTKVSKHIYKHTLSLFKLICENKKNWPEKALLNLLNGFYEDDPILVKETFNIFNLIEGYQNLPEIIQKNIEIEKKLLDGLYYNLKKEDQRIFEEMLKDFNELHGFSPKHKRFINQFNKFSFTNNIIYQNFINLIANKNFDIGKSIYTISIQRIDLNYFIKIYSKIITNPLVNTNYKAYALKRLDNELNNESNSTDQIMQLISHIKYFIDWIILPQKMINTLKKMLTKNNEDINNKKELIFSIGNYFSTKKQNQKELFIGFKKLVINEKLYQKIINSLEKEKFTEEELFYIYSSAQYYEKENFDFSKIGEIPLKVITKYIHENQSYYEYNEVKEKIKKFNDKFKFGAFSTERDASLRQLYLRLEPKSLDYLELMS